MSYLKQWSKPHKGIREMLKMGEGKQEAIHREISSKGYWRLPKTLATNSGLSNANLEWIRVFPSGS